MKRENELNTRVADAVRTMVESEKNMIKYDQRRLKSEEDLTKVNTKLEGEIKLRILFEQKINNLHFMNETAESRVKLLEE